MRLSWKLVRARTPFYLHSKTDKLSLPPPWIILILGYIGALCLTPIGLGFPPIGRKINLSTHTAYARNPLCSKSLENARVLRREKPFWIGNNEAISFHGRKLLDNPSGMTCMRCAQTWSVARMYWFQMPGKKSEPLCLWISADYTLKACEQMRQSLNPFGTQFALTRRRKIDQDYNAMGWTGLGGPKGRNRQNLDCQGKDPEKRKGRGKERERKGGICIALLSTTNVLQGASTGASVFVPWKKSIEEDEAARGGWEGRDLGCMRGAGWGGADKDAGISLKGAAARFPQGSFSATTIRFGRRLGRKTSKQGVVVRSAAADSGKPLKRLY